MRRKMRAGAHYAHYILLVFTCASILLLSFLVQNPLFLRKPATTALLVLGGSLLAGVLMVLAVRLVGVFLSPLLPAARISILPKLACLFAFSSTLALLILPVTFPEPARNPWVLVLVPVLGIAFIKWWKYFSQAATVSMPAVLNRGRGASHRLGTPAFLGVLVFIGALAFGSLRPYTIGGGAKVVVIGVDGATWRILDGLMTRDELPNLSLLMKEGSSGRLESVEPCFSSVVWTSISTGFLPQSHGIVDFNGTLSDVKKKGFWEILSEKGHRIGGYKWLLTWPPVDVNGFLVPAWLARDSTCYPPSLNNINRKRSPRILIRARATLLDIAFGLSDEGLFENFRHKAKSAIFNVDEVDDGIANQQIEEIRNRDFFQGLSRLFEVELGTCSFYGIDKLSHPFWQYMEPEHFRNVPEELIGRYGETIEEHYKMIDRLLGEILRSLDEDAYVLILSDHGFKAAASLKHFPCKPRGEILDYLDLPPGLIEVGNYKFDRLFMGVRKTENALEIARDLKERLSRVVLQGEKEPLLDVQGVDREVDRYAAVYMVKSREGVEFLPHQKVVTPAGICEFEDVFIHMPAVSGDHDIEDSIFLLKGPGVRKGYRAEGLSVLDVHPLVLYLFGVEVPRDVDGTLRMDLFDGESIQNPQYTASYGDRQVRKEKEVPLPEDVLQRMKALGYIE